MRTQGSGRIYELLICREKRPLLFPTPPGDRFDLLADNPGPRIFSGGPPSRKQNRDPGSLGESRQQQTIGDKNHGF